MDNTLIKNITVALVVLTMAFLGYYLFTMRDEITLSSGTATGQDLFGDVQKYAERRQVLDQVKLDTSVFSDERFLSLKGYTPTIPVYQEGRQNPFAIAESQPE